MPGEFIKIPPIEAMSLEALEFYHDQLKQMIRNTPVEQQHIIKVLEETRMLYVAEIKVRYEKKMESWE